MITAVLIAVKTSSETGGQGAFSILPPLASKYEGVEISEIRLLKALE
jgi:hypothetical protein